MNFKGESESGRNLNERSYRGVHEVLVLIRTSLDETNQCNALLSEREAQTRQTRQILFLPCNNSAYCPNSKGFVQI